MTAILGIGIPSVDDSKLIPGVYPLRELNVDRLLETCVGDVPLALSPGGSEVFPVGAGGCLRNFSTFSAIRLLRASRTRTIA